MVPVRRALVCGAGLTGLTTAWHLRRRGVDVTVLEAAPTVGGVMQTTHRDGYLVEQGPNSCMLTGEMATLVHALGLTAQLRPAAPQAQRRYIVRNGRALAVPSSPLAMLRSPLLGLLAKLRILMEPLIPRRITGGDESVADFVRRRLGAEPLTWAVDPFVSGVYAGDPERLSVRHAFPRLAALEREHGSLLRGAIAGARKSRIARGQPGLTSPRATMVSFVDGMGSLADALADAIGRDSILTDTRVVAITDTGATREVIVERDGVRSTLSADVAISTLPLHAVRRISLPQAAHEALATFATVDYPPVTSLVLGFRREQVEHALDGFGCLVPSAEQRTTLGVLFSTTLFEGRAPAGHVLLTCFVGGVRHRELQGASTDMLLRLVLPELAELLGVRGAPTFVHQTAWPQAIPQYNVGHDDCANAADAIEAAVSGLLVDGQFRRGVSVGDCVAAGEQIALRACAVMDRISPVQTRAAAAVAQDGEHVAHVATSVGVA